jgi:hypothetical protein
MCNDEDDSQISGETNAFIEHQFGRDDEDSHRDDESSHSRDLWDGQQGSQLVHIADKKLTRLSSEGFNGGEDELKNEGDSNSSLIHCHVHIQEASVFTDDPEARSEDEGFPQNRHSDESVGQGDDDDFYSEGDDYSPFDDAEAAPGQGGFLRYDDVGGDGVEGGVETAEVGTKENENPQVHHTETGEDEGGKGPKHELEDGSDDENGYPNELTIVCQKGRGGFPIHDDAEGDEGDEATLITHDSTRPSKPWRCAVCTYSHENSTEAGFLSCKMCRALRDVSNGGASPVNEHTCDSTRDHDTESEDEDFKTFVVDNDEHNDAGSVQNDENLYTRKELPLLDSDSEDDGDNDHDRSSSSSISPEPSSPLQQSTPLPSRSDPPFIVSEKLWDRCFPHQRDGVMWLWGLHKRGAWGDKPKATVDLSLSMDSEDGNGNGVLDKTRGGGGILGDDMGLGKTFQVRVLNLISDLPLLLPP